jgi:hypothetical protein
VADRFTNAEGRTRPLPEVDHVTRFVKSAALPILVVIVLVLFIQNALFSGS